MDKEIIFETREDFREWLKDNGQTSEGIWLIFGKAKAVKTLTAHEALEEALCFGWIDGLMNSIDADKYRKYFSRRRKSSNWSDKNKKLTEKLIQEGKMTDVGLQAIADGKKSGKWDQVKDRSISDIQRIEFESGVKENDLAYRNFCAMAKSTQNQFIGFYFEAKREETRLKRLEKIIGLLEQNKKLM